MRILLTGGAGFIGSAVVRQLIAETAHTVINVDALCYSGRAERSNLDLARQIRRLVDELLPGSGMGSRERLIQFVDDRPGHDFRYAIDPSRIEQDLGWRAEESLDSGLRKTVQWYLSRPDWITQSKQASRRQGFGGYRSPN